MYDFKNDALTAVRTADQFQPIKSLYEPDSPVAGTLFEGLGAYILQRVEAQVVVVKGRAFFDKPEELPAPIPYIGAERTGLRERA
jgi:hypothetical protein